MLTKQHAQVGYPPKDKELVPFFNKSFSDFDGATLAFTIFLKHLFAKVIDQIEKEPELADPKAWRKWLDGNKNNRDRLYGDVLTEVRLEVRGYLRALAARWLMLPTRELQRTYGSRNWKTSRQWSVNCQSLPRVADLPLW